MAIRLKRSPGLRRRARADRPGRADRHLFQPDVARPRPLIRRPSGRHHVDRAGTAVVGPAARATPNVRRGPPRTAPRPTRQGQTAPPRAAGAPRGPPPSWPRQPRGSRHAPSPAPPSTSDTQKAPSTPPASPASPLPRPNGRRRQGAKERSRPSVFPSPDSLPDSHAVRGHQGLCQQHDERMTGLDAQARRTVRGGGSRSEIAARTARLPFCGL